MVDIGLFLSPPSPLLSHFQRHPHIQSKWVLPFHFTSLHFGQFIFFWSAVVAQMCFQRKKVEKQRQEEIDDSIAKYFSTFEGLLATKPEHWLEKYLVSVCVCVRACVREYEGSKQLIVWTMYNNIWTVFVSVMIGCEAISLSDSNTCNQYEWWKINYLISINFCLLSLVIITSLLDFINCFTCYSSNHMLITCLSHDCHMLVTYLSHACHMLSHHM